ncbi:MAG: PorT family protein [Bacteroidales bacterium]|nr:PorT family protein [Bacteroidales bacterium]
MKKTFLSVALVMFAFYLSAQTRAGITGGYNLSSPYSYGGKMIGNDVPAPDWGIKSGFQGGLSLEFPLSDRLYLQPSLFFASHGFKDRYEMTGSKKTAQRVFSFYSLQVPVNVQYKLDVGIPEIVFQVAPFIRYNLFGRQRYFIENVSKTLEDEYKKLKFGNNKETDNIQPAFQYGVGAGVGIQVSRLLLMAGYNFGLSELSLRKQASGRNYDVRLKTGDIFVNLTIYFGKYPPLFPEE